MLNGSLEPRRNLLLGLLEILFPGAHSVHVLLEVGCVLHLVELLLLLPHLRELHAETLHPQLLLHLELAHHVDMSSSVALIALVVLFFVGVRIRSELEAPLWIVAHLFLVHWAVVMRRH